MSYKWARGPLGNKSGNPVRVMNQDFVQSKDKTQTWFNTPSGDAPDIVLSATIPEDGHPNQEELQDVTTMEGFFCSLHTKYHEPYL